VPVAIAVAKRLDVSPRQLLMPLSFAGLISGMLTLIATAPNLVVNAELARHGLDGFGFFAPTPFGLVVLVLGIGYMLVVRRWIGDAEPEAGRTSRRTIADILDAYALDGVPRRVLVADGSPLADRTLADLDLPGRA
jgi:di/tricarboxylate transporter